MAALLKSIDKTETDWKFKIVQNLVYCVQKQKRVIYYYLNAYFVWVFIMYLKKNS